MDKSHPVPKRFTWPSKRHTRASPHETQSLLQVFRKIPYGKNDWNLFPVRPLGLMSTMTDTVVLYLGCRHRKTLGLKGHGQTESSSTTVSWASLSSQVKCFSHFPLLRNTIYLMAVAVVSESGSAGLSVSASGACWLSRSCLGVWGAPPPHFG